MFQCKFYELGKIFSHAIYKSFTAYNITGK